MKKKRRGFTLIELLAVIVILAVILVIAVPSIMDTIKESRKGALVSSAKLIASTAETAKLSNDTLGIEKKITCSDVAQLTDEDYTSCSIKFVDGKAQVTIVGQGKFEGMSVCSGTKENAEVRDGNDCPLPAVERIESLATETNTEGLELTSDGNIRYTGSSPKNYIKFNDEDWRIIGTFTVTIASGTTEKLMKIVKDTSIGGYSWDSSESSVNNGYGVNEWSEADLMTELNTLYLNQGSGTCYNGSNNASTTCNFTSTGINSVSRNMIEEVVWNTGAITYASTIPVETAYNAERGTTTGKICSSGIYCNDSVTRTTTWQGKVGLIYPSDYGYASTDTSCRANIYDTLNLPCKNTNWLNSGSTYWTVSPVAGSSYANNAWFVLSGDVAYAYAWNGVGVRPAIYLKSDVSITSGDGSSGTNAYQISMN